MIALEELDRYRQPTPYEALGAAPDATAKEILNQRNTLQRDAQEGGGDPGRREKEIQRVGAAYDLLCNPGVRVRVDFFLLDPKLFLKQCQAIAGEVPKPKAEIEGALKPRQIRVNHAALLDEMRDFFAEPVRVAGLSHRPMEFPAETSLPEPLAIVFDC